jgi:hypothetical protein
MSQGLLVKQLRRVVGPRLDMMLNMIVAYRAKSPTYWVERRNRDIIDAIWRWHLKEYGASRPESGSSMFQVLVLFPG